MTRIYWKSELDINEKKIKQARQIKSAYIDKIAKEINNTLI
jgi:hypothetical protein